MHGKNLLIVWAGVALGVLLSVSVVVAGNLDPAGDPLTTGSRMFSLQQIYDRLVSGAMGEKAAIFAEPQNGPTVGTMATLNELMAAAPAVDNTQGATADQVLSGRRFWGLRTDGAGRWGVQVGVLPDRGAGETVTPTTTDRVLPAGFYSTPITVTGDSALFPDSIAGGVTIFGVAGAAQDTSSGDATAGDLLAGSVAWADGAAITGTIPARGVGPTLLPTTTVQTLESGYWSTPITVTGDSDLVAGNLHAGATLFGVTGDGAVVDTSSGDATAADLLAGAVVWADGLEITGAIANRGVAPTLVPTTTAQSLGEGSWSTSITVTGDSDLVAGNIRQGVTLFGVTGDGAVADTRDATATASDLLNGKVAWANGVEVTGAVAERGIGATITPTNTDQIAAAGYWSTPITVTGDATLLPDNIRGGVTLFGVQGASMIANTTNGNATADDLVAGKVAWVDGRAITGTISGRGAGSTLLPTTIDQIQAAGYWSTPITVTGDSDLVADNIAAGVTLFDVPGTGADTSSGNVVAGDLLLSRVAWANGVRITGTLAVAANSFTPSRSPITPTTTNQILPLGYYHYPVPVLGDSDLAPENVRGGVNLFGVAGAAPAGTLVAGRVPRTGQLDCYAKGDNILLVPPEANIDDGLEWKRLDYYSLLQQSKDCTTLATTGIAGSESAHLGQDGNLRKGIAWPVPRFIDNNNGTVTDALTGLIWLKETSCTDALGGKTPSLPTSGDTEFNADNAYMNWTDALVWTKSLASGKCGLTDGSAAGAWRVPNVNELRSLLYFDAYIGISQTSADGFPYDARVGASSAQMINTQGNPAAVNSTPFASLPTRQDDYPFYRRFWTSTSDAGTPAFAWTVSFYNVRLSDSTLDILHKNPATYYTGYSDPTQQGNQYRAGIWAVRGGP